MRLSVVISFLFVSSAPAVLAQNAYFRLGKQAYIDANFKMAVQQLEKACALDSTNTNALFMLGYSYYHSDDYVKSISTFTRELNLAPTESSAFYYRGLAKEYLGKDTQLAPADRERHLIGAIVDFTKAIAFNPNDAKTYYQNRGIAYREYAIFKLQGNLRTYDKFRAIEALKASVIDFEKILAADAGRNDIIAQLDITKEKLSTAIGPRKIKN